MCEDGRAGAAASQESQDACMDEGLILSRDWEVWSVLVPSHGGPVRLLPLNGTLSPLQEPRMDASMSSFAGFRKESLPLLGSQACCPTEGI